MAADQGLIIALIVAVGFAFVGGVAAGLFFGMWWQARQTAMVWEKTYTHVRELLPILHDTYNTGKPDPAPPAPAAAIDVQRGLRAVEPSDAAKRLALDDDPMGVQTQRLSRS